MAKEKQLLIEVRDKIATLKSKNFNLVGGNNDYDVVFDFDEDWQDLNAKTAIFVFDNENPVYVPFDGNVCEGVAINDATMCLIGVFSGDLRTTTPAVVDCVYRSILDEANGTPAPPKEDVYNQIIDLINKYIKEIDIVGKYAPLVDGKVPAENLPSYMDDVVEGSMSTSFGDFRPSGEHNEKVDSNGNVIPRKGVLYVDVSGAYIGKVFRWSGTAFVQVASTNLPDASELNKGQFLMSDGSSYTTEEVRQLPIILETSDSGKVLLVDDATRKAAWVTPPWAEKSYVDGLVGDISTALDKSNAYDIIITSQEQFLSERANFRGKRVLFKDARFTLQEIDFNYAECVEFCNVAVGSTSFVVRIRNFKFGNFAGFTRGWYDSSSTYNCDDLYVENFAFAENLIPPIDSVHGSGDKIIYSNGLGIMNCAVSNATNCCNIVNCHVIGRSAVYFNNCTSISNLHAKSFYSNVFFENCTHLSNIALLESGSTFAITYTNCSDVDPDTCDGYEGSKLPTVSTSDNGKILQVVDGAWQTAYPDVDKAYVDGLVGDISTALDELHTYAQNLVNGGIA